MAEGNLKLYTVYERPADMWDDGLPFAVREFTVEAGGQARPGWVRWASTLDFARELVPSAADQLVPRDADDEPHIVETWL